MSDMPDKWAPDDGQRRGGKSAAAFRTISEVSSELDVPQHVLRFWETKFSQVKPLKRAGGRRYYRPEDVELLRRIRDLLYRDGFTIKGAQKFLRESHVARAPAPPSASAPASPAPDTAREAEASPAATGVSQQDPGPPSAAKGASEREKLKEVLGELMALRQLLRSRLG